MELRGDNGVTQAGFDVSNPMRSFARTVRAVIIEPRRFFRELSRQETSNNPVLFAGIFVSALFVFPEVLTLLNPLLPDRLDFPRSLDWIPGEGPSAIGTALLLALLTLPFLYLLVAVQHLFVAIFVRQRRGFDATLCAVAYSAVFWPFQQIPVVGYLVTLYLIYVSFLGVRELHATTTVRALLAVLGFNALFWLPQIVSFFRSLPGWLSG